MEKIVSDVIKIIKGSKNEIEMEKATWELRKSYLPEFLSRLRVACNCEVAKASGTSTKTTLSSFLLNFRISRSKDLKIRKKILKRKRI